MLQLDHFSISLLLLHFTLLFRMAVTFCSHFGFCFRFPLIPITVITYRQFKNKINSSQSKKLLKIVILHFTTTAENQPEKVNTLVVLHKLKIKYNHIRL